MIEAWIMGIFFGLLLLGIIGYYVYKGYKSEQPLHTTQKSQPMVTSVETKPLEASGNITPIDKHHVTDRKTIQPDIRPPNFLDFTLAQLSSPQFNSSPTSEDDVNVVSQARGLLSRGDIGDNYDKVMQLIIQGLSTCNRKDRLCELLGNIYLNRKDSVSIGWCMQSCILGSPSWVPYLMLYYAARYWVPTVPLSRRCVVASEILCAPDMKRMDEIELQIVSVIKAPQCDYNVLVKSMLAFENTMDPYLPAHDKFSFYQDERAAYYMANSRQFETEEFRSIRRKLLERQ